MIRPIGRFRMVPSLSIERFAPAGVAGTYQRTITLGLPAVEGHGGALAAGRPVTELVERRGIGRNANQQSTCRAQNRESVSRALGRATSRNDMLPVAKLT